MSTALFSSLRLRRTARETTLRCPVRIADALGNQAPSASDPGARGPPYHVNTPHHPALALGARIKGSMRPSHFVELVAHLLLLRFEVAGVMLVGWDLDGDLLGDLNAVNLQPVHLLGIVGEDSELA